MRSLWPSSISPTAASTRSLRAVGVIGRGVEDRLLDKAIELCRRHGHRRIIGEYIPTRKNQMVAEFYECHGFAQLSKFADGRITYEKTIDDRPPEAREIQAAIRFLSSMLGLPEGELGPNSSMDNTPTWDSVEHMNICLLFERQFGIKMNMDIITSVTSIRALAELIP